MAFLGRKKYDPQMSEARITKKMERGTSYLVEACICFMMTFGKPLLYTCIPFIKYYYLVDLLVYTASINLLYDEDNKIRDHRPTIFGTRLLRNMAQYASSLLGLHCFTTATAFTSKVNWTLALGVSKALIEIGYDWTNNYLDEHYNNYNCPCGHTIIGI